MVFPNSFRTILVLVIEGRFYIEQVKWKHDFQHYWSILFFFFPIALSNWSGNNYFVVQLSWTYGGKLYESICQELDFMHHFDTDFCWDTVDTAIRRVWDLLLRMFNIAMIIAISSKISGCLYIGSFIPCFAAIQHNLSFFLLIWEVADR